MIKRKLTMLPVYLLAFVFTLSGCNTTPAQSSKPERPSASLAQAAEQGDSQAAYQFGENYYHGWGVAQDKNEAVKWYRKAAERGHRGAEVRLAAMYHQGDGVHQDQSTAAGWFRKAAESQSQAQPEQLAQDRSGLDTGWTGDDAEVKRTLAKLRHAAEQGDLEAQYKLGNQYRLGVQQDLTQTVKWWRAAALAGHVNAQYDLAQMYQTAAGVPKDTAEATRWYEMAVRQGHAKALEALLELDENTGRLADQKKHLAVFDSERQQRALEEFGTVGLAVPRLKPAIKVQKPEKTTSAVRSVLRDLLNGTVSGAGLGAQSGVFPVAIGMGVAGAFVGTGLGIEKAVENSQSKKIYKKAIKRLPLVLSAANIQAGLQNQIVKLVKQRSSNPLVVLETADAAVDTVLQFSSFSVELAGTTLSIHAEGQLRRKTDNTPVNKRVMTYSRSIVDQDLGQVVADGYKHFANEMVSHLMGLPELPSLPTVDELPSVDSQGSLRVALLPIEFAGTSDNSVTFTPETLTEQAKRVITDVPALELVESDQIQGSDLLIQNRERKTLSVLESEPNLDFIYSRGTQAGLDVAVMIFFSSDYMGYMYYNDAELYVIDLKHRQVLHASVPTKVGDRHDIDIERKLRATLEKTVAASGTQVTAKKEVGDS